jgi:hypothetical protein
VEGYGEKVEGYGVKGGRIWGERWKDMGFRNSLENKESYERWKDMGRRKFSLCLLRLQANVRANRERWKDMGR